MAKGIMQKAQKASKGVKAAASKSSAGSKQVHAASQNTQLASNFAKQQVIAWMDDHPDQCLTLWAQIQAGLVDSKVARDASSAAIAPPRDSRRNVRFSCPLVRPRLDYRAQRMVRPETARSAARRALVHVAA